MSEVSDQIETAIDATVEAAAEVAAPVQAAAATVVETATKTVKAAAKRVSKPRAKAVSVPKAAAVIAAVPVIVAARKAGRKAKASIARRKYVRKNVAAATAASAPLIKGLKTMTDTNWFASLPAMPGADKFQSLFGDVSAKSQDAVKKSQAFAEQMSEAAKANLEAVVESSRIAAAGARDLGQEVVASTKSSVEHAQSAVKTLADAKSPTEFFQLQSELMRASFDRMVSEGSKLTEQMVKLAGEATQPLSSRASVNAEKFSELTA